MNRDAAARMSAALARRGDTTSGKSAGFQSALRARASGGGGVWDESKHPRGKDGRFASGGSGGEAQAGGAGGRAIGTDPNDPASWSEKIDPALERNMEAAVEAAQMHKILVEHPLRSVSTRLQKDSEPYGGLYDGRTRRLYIHPDWANAETVNRQSRLGYEDAFLVEREGARAVDVTMVHELSHHMHFAAERLDPSLGEEIRNAYHARVSVDPDKGVTTKGWLPSKYSASDEYEWFAEMHTAMTYHTSVLREKDPEGFALLQRVRKALGG